MRDTCHGLPIRNQYGEVRREVGRMHEKVGTFKGSVDDGQEEVEETYPSSRQGMNAEVAILAAKGIQFKGCIMDAGN
jgi:hypothetical protein